MTANTFTLTHPSINSGVAVRVLADKVVVGGKANVKTDPDANPDNQVEVQKESVENLTYAVQGVHFKPEIANTLTYPMLLILYKLQYGGASATGATAPLLMTVTYGKPSASVNLVGYDGVTTSIQVMLKDFNFPIDVKDSTGGYMPVGSFNLVETL